jgi:antitoxin component YwqK of YwqJK toxin-antitoxin module
MHHKIIIIISLSTLSLLLSAQAVPDTNLTDHMGRKQGLWIKNYPDGNIQYEGVFTDDHPVGEFIRYNEDNTISSVLIYSSDGKEADATFYHPNGFIAAKGKYINQMKEGRWLFYSSFYEGYLISEDLYVNNMRNGPSLQFFPDTTVSERIMYVNGKKDGEWVQYYTDGKLFLRSGYSDDKLNGKFEVWYENGQLEISGNYKDNMRNGPWFIYNQDGTLRYKMDYTLGVTNDRQMDIDASDLMDRLEKTRGRIPDPEKTGEIK